MAKYHISLSGEPALCKARTRPCPRTEHYDSLKTAQQVAQLAHENYAGALEYPRPDSLTFLQKQAHIFWRMDQHFGAGASPYLAQGHNRASSDSLRESDYKEGFKIGLWATDNHMQDAAVIGFRRERYEQARSGRGLWPADETAFRAGYARAQRIKNADRDEFVTEHTAATVPGSSTLRERYGKARFLHQPFRRGETIVVPAGTKYHEWDTDGNDVHGEFKEAREVKVNDTFDATIDGGANAGPNSGAGMWVQLKPATVSYAGPHGRWRDIALTPEIVAANGKSVYEAGIYMENLIRQPLEQEINR